MSDLKVSLVLQLKNLLGSGLKGIRGDLRALKDETKGLGSVKGPDASGLARYSSEARRSAQALRELKREQANLGASKTGQNSILAGTGRAAMILGGIGAGAYAGRQAIGATVGQAITFEKAMAAVRKKVDAPDEAGFQRLEKTINRIASDYGLARAQVAELTAEAGASGIAFEDLERFMRMTAKAAVAWDMSAPEASQKLAEIKSGTQMTIAELERLAEKINGLGDNSAAKERDIVEMFGRAGAAAKAAGVNFDVSLAALTAVRSTGLQPEIASRWFAAFTGGLATIEEAKDKAQEGLKLLGLDAKKVAKGMKTDALGTMLDIFDRLQKSPEAATAAIKIFGKEWWDETSRAAQALPELKKQLEFLKSGKWQGSLDKTLNIELATTANHLERLKALTSEIGDRLGRWALPPINAAIDGLIKKYDELQERIGNRKGTIDPSQSPDWADGNDPSQAPDVKAVGDAIDGIFSRIGEAIFGKKLTKDAARKQAEALGGTSADADALAKKQAEEAAILRIQAQNAKKKDDKARLNIEAGKKEAEAESNAELAARARRSAGQAAGRDMTNVEGGMQQLDKPYSEKSEMDRKHLQRLEGLLQKAGNASTVTDPATGWSGPVDAVRKKVEELKARLGEVPGEAAKTGAAVKDKMTMDLTGEGANAASSFAAGFTNASASALAAAQSLAAQIRATVSTPAASVGGGRPTTGGGATGPAKVPTVQVGGITVNGAGDPERAARLVEQRLAGAVRSALAGAHHDGVA